MIRLCGQDLRIIFPPEVLFRYQEVVDSRAGQAWQKKKHEHLDWHSKFNYKWNVSLKKSCIEQETISHIDQRISCFSPPSKIFKLFLSYWIHVVTLRLDPHQLFQGKYDRIMQRWGSYGDNPPHDFTKSLVRHTIRILIMCFVHTMKVRG